MRGRPAPRKGESSDPVLAKLSMLARFCGGGAPKTPWRDTMSEEEGEDELDPAELE